ncbi:Rpn family recombination-promoting nuclease/putative transposase [Nocardia sp. NBC_01503]|uniref:Rpn family recombination-promoting nuclease/putative transposase n=1 Tax=Nocardia sp. NBC_01503 TaxID=2975997 RepID=UPI002E7BC3B9|nr:Rpn family recombination-promoting nuclease/putative transposase [Nocardia sp. NBC_01503]WTL29684.1 Rpn family recombination-promoting nuclease/putative transposase [Nocardia sp. NBC_01503]
MADSPSNPHDAYFRQVLARPADAASELRTMLPKAVAARLDWDTLVLQPCSFVSQHLRSRYSDLLFRTRLDGHEAYIYLLVEHQSRSDPLMPMRLVEYLVGIWNRYVREHPGTVTVPAVIPLVVHASRRGRRWNTPTELADLIDIDPATRDALGDYLPRFRFLLDDLTAHAVPALCARELTPAARVMLVLLKIAAGNPNLDTELLPLLQDLRALLAAPGGTDDLECVVTYILTVGETSDTDLGPVIDRLGPHAKEVIVTTAQRLRAEGRAETVLELLALKFGPLPAETAATVRAADAAQLRSWTASVLTATSLDEVFQQ